MLNVKMQHYIFVFVLKYMWFMLPMIDDSVTLISYDFFDIFFFTGSKLKTVLEYKSPSAMCCIGYWNDRCIELEKYVYS